jgi:glycosyltransferase involved in cell wall biosynthesis
VEPDIRTITPISPDGDSRTGQTARSPQVSCREPSSVVPPTQRGMPGRVLIIVENEAAFNDQRVSKQIDTLLQNGYCVYVITRRHERNEPYRSHPLVCLFEYRPPAEPSSLLGYLLEYGYSFFVAAFFSLRTAMHERIDVVQFCQPPDVYFPLARVLRRFGARIVVDQRDLLPELYTARYGAAPRGVLSALRFLEKLSHKSADHIIGVNEYYRERALAGSGLAADRVSVVRNGPVLARVRDARGDESLKRGRRYLACWVGMMGRQDGVDLLLQSIHRVVHELGRDDCQFVIIGHGECLAETQALARELKLREWVHFTGGLSEEGVFRYLATADLGLDASLQFDVSPVKAMEYMAFGLPFVSFDLPETRAISEGAAAHAVPGDIAAHAGAIDALLSSPQRREELGRTGRVRVGQELAWDHQALTYLRVIEQICLVTTHMTGGAG